MRPSIVIMAWFYQNPHGNKDGPMAAQGVRLPPRGHLPNRHDGEQSVLNRCLVRCVTFVTPQVWKQVKQATASTVTGKGFAGHWQPLIMIATMMTSCAGETDALCAVPSLLRPGSLPQATATWRSVQRLLPGDAAFAHARLVGILRCRAIARLPPLGRPHDHGGLVSVGV